MRSLFLTFLSIISLTFLSIEAKGNEAVDSVWTTDFSQIPIDTADFNKVKNVLSAKARALKQYVQVANKLVDKLDLSKVYQLPIGIKTSLGGLDYIIVIETIQFNQSGGFLVASMVLTLPNGKEIAFRGEGIKIAGGSISGPAKLTLIEDVPIKLSEQMLLTIKADEGKSYVNFSCSGYETMGISSELTLSRDMVIPEKPDGTLGEGRVTAKVEVPVMKEWGDVIAKISLPPFQVRGLNGFGFYVKDATFDYSELSLIPGAIYPEGYTSVNPFLNDPLWQGIYIKEVAVKLPPQFESTDKKRLEVGASQIVIDDMGFSGQLRLTGTIIGMDKGKLGDWPFSLDSLGVSVIANQLKGGGIKGKLLVPIFDPNDPLVYRALINTGGNYIFNVTTTGEKKIDLWSARVFLDPGSSVQIKVTEEKFYPKAVLHGKLSISAGTDADVSLADIAFQNLEVQTIKPYLKVGAFALSSEKLQQKMSNFPVTLNQVGGVTKDNDFGILLDIAVNLMGEDDGGFAADGNFTVWGTQKEGSDAKINWKFKTVELNSLKVDVDGGAYKINGFIASYKAHPVYGKGFKGSVEASFTPGLTVAATVQFGNKDFRYWYVDALLILPTGIAVSPAFGLYGFGGGAYYKMSRTNPAKAVALPASESANPTDNTSDAGKTLSGITYVPDSKVKIGIKATVVIGTFPSPQPFNGDATFEIAFNETGGAKIAFTGNAYFMTEIEKRSPNAPVYANMNIEYDTDSKVLFSNLNIYMNIAGAIRGNGENNLAGSAVMYFSPDEWYIHIGTPDARNSVKLMDILDASSYFMVGTTIPGMPEPPANVSEILGGGDFNFMRDENALSKGGGFCFGSALTVGGKDMTYLIFYANLSAGAGFDLMLKNYGKGVRCEGQNKPLGINGWYASGQAYAYMQGKVGIKVDLKFVKGNYEILDIGAAAILQAKLPNPFWMQGTVGGYYNILGGLVKGQCKFQATLGESCKIEGGGSVVQGIEVISEISPATGSKDVTTFNAPQSAFNMEIGKIFELVDFDNTKKSFRISLDFFKLYNGNTEIATTQNWNATNDVLAIQSADILPGEKQLKIAVKIHFEELKNGNWTPVMANGKIVDEYKEATFTTGKAPDFIPLSNVAYSYPIIEQHNFHKDEYAGGYIQLKQGQDYLFTPSDNFKQLARFSSDKGNVDFDFSYNATANKIEFKLPINITNGTIYSFSLKNIPQNAEAKVDKNVRTVSENQSKTEGVTIEVQRKEIDGNLDLAQETDIYSTVFRTSKYNSFSQKMKSLKLSEAFSRPVLNGVDELGININGEELFDQFEFESKNGIKALIQYEASLDNKWYKNEVGPVLYNKYPLDNAMVIDWRTPDSIGVPPVRAVSIGNKSMDKSQIESDFYGVVPDFIAIDYAEIVYSFPFYSFKDYMDLRNKAAINYSRTNNKDYIPLMTNTIPNIKPGTYKLKIKYMLPGINIVTSENEVSFRNP